MAKSRRNIKGNLSSCQADPRRMSTSHLRELFNSIPKAELERRINDLPDGQLRVAMRRVARSFVAA